LIAICRIVIAHTPGLWLNLEHRRPFTLDVAMEERAGGELVIPEYPFAEDGAEDPFSRHAIDVPGSSARARQQR
jgi:hypothetical protein